MDDIYTYMVPIFIKTLGGLGSILAKAQVHIRRNGISEEALLNDRLAPDMFPLIKQVQVACDNAKGAAGRLSGMEPPKFDDTETTLEQLRDHIDQTIAFLETLSPDAFADAAHRRIILPYFADKYMTGFEYAREYALPNFFFHAVTAYDLCRKNGVPIGKSDYINGLPLKDLS